MLIDLHRAWAGLTYQKLYTPSAQGEPIFLNVCIDNDDDLWRVYRQPSDARGGPARPSHAIITAMYQARLYRVVDETINIYCGTRGQVTAYKVLAVYRKLLDWKESLPPVLADIGESDQPLPHILFLQYVYILNEIR